MGCEMRPKLLAGLMLFALAGCGSEDAKPSEDELAETPQIASLEEYGLPVDKSDQITAIDAATGDSSGMPRDGGAVVAVKKADTREVQETPGASIALPAAAAPPPLFIPEPPPPAASVTAPLPPEAKR